MAIYGSLGEINVGALSSTISDTALDVFVYDTRKDSDGGAWRKRTQHTSWYNETLNTATRGSRREFPAVAIIVTTSNKLTIYDGDDPDFPMWMVFNGAGVWNQGLYYNLTVSGCVFALNGIVAWGDGANAFGLITVNFINESSVARTSGNTYGGFSGVPLINRNSSSAATFNNGISGTHTAGVINANQVRDVAMTVLPNAPIDSSTGLPIPTIVVSSELGINVIRENNVITSVAGAASSKISVNNKLFYFAYPANGGYYGIALDGNAGDIDSFFNTVGNLKILSNVNSNTNNNIVVPNEYNLYSGQTSGLTIINKDFLKTYNDYNGLVSWITTNYNTGWMPGDIKGTFLSDISVVNVTGTELITNGDGTTTTGWTAGTNNTLIVTGGNFKCTTNQNDGAFFGQGVSVVIGKTYVFQATIVSDGTSKAVRMYLGPNVGSGGYAINSEGAFISNGIVSIYWTATFTGTAYLWFYGQTPTSGTYILVDNVSARIAEPDRSVNAKGLAVYGTLTKSVVETGADLIAYSGWSTSNYIQQPYNSALNFGTGDFSFMLWFKSNTSSNPNNTPLFWKGQTDTNSYAMIEPYIRTTDGGIDFLIRNSAETNQIASYTTSIMSQTWRFLCFVRRSGILEIYVDGILVSTATGNLNVNPSTAAKSRFEIGSDVSKIKAIPGSVSLYRVSATAPTAGQIKKIYNDEKALFQPNSKSVLYGSSDSITAAAYDDTTKLLHVGTSSGRSDFQGLERINNTTTAVTTAISASNGLIAEQ